MSRIDPFESVFKSAAKPHDLHDDVQMPRVLVLTDIAEANRRLEGGCTRGKIVVEVAK